MPLNQTAVGSLIKRLREARDMTRKELAKKAKITYHCVYCMETKPDTGMQTKTAYKLARAFRVPVFRLFMTEVEWAKFQGKTPEKSKTA